MGYLYLFTNTPPILDTADTTRLFTVAEWYAAKMLSAGLPIYFYASFNFYIFEFCQIVILALSVLAQ